MYFEKCKKQILFLSYGSYVWKVPEMHKVAKLKLTTAVELKAENGNKEIQQYIITLTLL